MNIGLLTPYSGTNLGDGTIQTAAIQNLIKRDPTAQLLGITLRPSETARRHGIPAFPITGLMVEWYSDSLFLPKDFTPPPESGEPAPPVEPPPKSGLRERLKSFPLLGPVLKFLVFRARGVRRIAHEIGHLAKSYGVVRRLNLVVISGGGQLDDEYGGPWGHPYAIFRWAMLARLAGTKLAVASVGAQTMAHPLSRFLVRAALATASYRSYREVHTKRQLASWRFTAQDPIVPDLAFSMDVAAIPPAPALPGHGALVGLSPIVFGHPEHWPTANLSVFQDYLRNLVDLAMWLVDRGNRLLLFRTSGADRIVVADFKHQLLSRAGAGIMERIHEPTVLTVQQFFAEVQAADLVVASRLHGVILSHLLHKPVLGISFERKVDAHMEDMDQLQYRVDIRDHRLEDLTTRFEAMERNADLERSRIAERVADRRAQLDAQYDSLIQIARTVSRPGIATKAGL